MSCQWPSLGGRNNCHRIIEEHIPNTSEPQATLLPSLPPPPLFVSSLISQPLQVAIAVIVVITTVSSSFAAADNGSFRRMPPARQWQLPPSPPAQGSHLYCCRISPRPSPPPMWLIVMSFIIFVVTFHSNCLIIYIVIPHLTTIPVLEEPRLHANVAHNARAKMPTCGCLRRGVGISIHLAEGVFPQNLLQGRMICRQRQKNTMIYCFYGFACKCAARRAKLENQLT
jgi:hypothetical protein